MQKDLNYFKQKIKQKIKEKRKKTDFRDFLKEIVSWHPFVLTKNNGLISRFPDSKRVKICNKDEFEKNREDLVKNGLGYDFKKDFWSNYKDLFKNIGLPNIFHYQKIFFLVDELFLHLKFFILHI